MLQEELVFPKDYGLRYAVLSFLRKVGMSCSRTGFTYSKFSPPLFAYSGKMTNHTQYVAGILPYNCQHDHSTKEHKLTDFLNAIITVEDGRK